MNVMNSIDVNRSESIGTDHDDHSCEHNASFSSRSIFNSVAAGYCSGITGTIVGHPLDSLKVWLQTTTNFNHKQPNTMTNSGNTTSTSIPKRIQSNVTTVSNTTTRSMSTTLLPSIQMQRSLAIESPSTTFMTISRNAYNQTRSLYAGVSGPLLTTGLVQSMNFAIYDSCRRVLYSYDDACSTTVQSHDNHHRHKMEYLNSDSLFNVGLSSMFAGSIVSIVTNPLLLVKTRQQTASRRGHHVGFIETFREMLRSQHTLVTENNSHDKKQHISKILFRGYAPHFIAEVLGRGVYFVVYEWMKRQFIQNKKRNLNDTTTTPPICTLQERMISAAAAGISCWTIIYPFDAIRCRIFAADCHNNNDISSVNHRSTPITTRQMISSMYATGGIRSFFRGFWITIIRAGPVAAFVLPVYDLSLEQISAM